MLFIFQKFIHVHLFTELFCEDFSSHQKICRPCVIPEHIEVEVYPKNLTCFVAVYMVQTLHSIIFDQTQLRQHTSFSIVVKPRKIYSYQKADWEKMKSRLKEDGNKILRTTTEATAVDNILSSFTITLQKEQIYIYVPARMSRSRKKFPWISPETKQLNRKQRDLLKEQKGTARASWAAQHYRSLMYSPNEASRRITGGTLVVSSLTKKMNPQHLTSISGSL